MWAPCEAHVSCHQGAKPVFLDARVPVAHAAAYLHFVRLGVGRRQVRVEYRREYNQGQVKHRAELGPGEAG